MYWVYRPRRSRSSSHRLATLPTRPVRKSVSHWLTLCDTNIGERCIYVDQKPPGWPDFNRSAVSFRHVLVLSTGLAGLQTRFSTFLKLRASHVCVYCISHTYSLTNAKMPVKFTLASMDPSPVRVPTSKAIR